MVHVSRHTLADHNDEANRLVKEGAKVSVVHKLPRRRWSPEHHSNKRKRNGQTN